MLNAESLLNDTSLFFSNEYDSVMCRYFCIRFIDFMLNAESLWDDTSLFFSNKYEMNDKIFSIESK